MVRCACRLTIDEVRCYRNACMHQRDVSDMLFDKPAPERRITAEMEAFSREVRHFDSVFEGLANVLLHTQHKRHDAKPPNPVFPPHLDAHTRRGHQHVCLPPSLPPSLTPLPHLIRSLSLRLVPRLVAMLAAVCPWQQQQRPQQQQQWEGAPPASTTAPNTATSSCRASHLHADRERARTTTSTISSSSNISRTRSRRRCRSSRRGGSSTTARHTARP